MKNKKIRSNRDKRRAKVRAHISGTAKRPRLSVYKSNKMVYAQLVDDEKAVTLASAKGVNSNKVGREIAEKALAKKIKEIVFDRGGYLYTGKISTLASSARDTGLKF